MKLRNVKQSAFSICLLTVAQLVHANPSEGEVSHGTASITYGQHTIIQQQSNTAIINWKDFNINENEHTQFVVPHAKSTTLNRVTSGNPSAILGRLSSNGQVFLINPNGIMFGKNARIDVGGLVASTANISDNNFINGRYVFDQPGALGAKIQNFGNITTISDHGLVALVAPQVVNAGVIQAQLGKVALAAGDRWTLDLYGDQLITFSVPLDAHKQLYRVDQEGTVSANGGMVLLTAQTADNILESVINMNGYIEAKTVAQTSGNVIVLGNENSVVMVSGTINVDAQEYGNAGNVLIMSDLSTAFTGVISAQGGRLGGDGGTVETSSKGSLLLEGGRVNTLAPAGKSGNWLLDPDYFVLNPATGAAVLAGLATNATVTLLADIDFTVAAGYDFTWANGNTLTIAAGNNIILGAGSHITNSSTGTLNLRADYDANGSGTISFGAGSGVNFAGSTGVVNFFYNPTDYAHPTDYSSFVQASSGKFHPYMLVNNLSNLQAIQTNLAGDYALGANIAAGASIYMNGGLGFDPIGDLTNPFTGSLNFAGYAISNLVINRPTENVIGLIGAAEDADFSYINMLDNSIVGRNLVGTFAGKILRGTITGTSYVRGNVTGNDAVGISYGSIQETYITGNTVSVGNVIGHDYVGGVTGAAVNNIIIGNIFHVGDTTGHDNVGGLVGTLTRDASVVGLVFNNGNVTGVSNVGGIAGSVSGIDFNINGTVGLGGLTGVVSAGGVGGGIIGSLNTNIRSDTNALFASFFGASGIAGLQRYVGVDLAYNSQNSNNSTVFRNVPPTVLIDSTIYSRLGGNEGIFASNRADNISSRLISTSATDIFKNIVTSDLIGGLFDKAFDENGRFRATQFTDSFVSNITTALSESNKHLSATGVMTMGAGIGGLLLSSRGGILNDAFGQSLGANLLALFGMVSMSNEGVDNIDNTVGAKALAEASTSAWCGVTCRLVMLSVQSPTKLPGFSDSMGVNPSLYVNSSIRPNSETEQRYTWDNSQNRYIRTEALNQPYGSAGTGIIKISSPL